jgi:phosphopantothenoylcysteine synthetase/decarboxylase
LADDWTVRVVATPMATSFIDAAELQSLTGCSVRSTFAAAGENRPRAAEAHAVIVAPATYNTMNKLARGINDTYALNVVSEAIGRGARTAILPFVNEALARRRPFIAAVAALRAEGVDVLLDADRWTPHPTGAGEHHIAVFPWRAALAAVTEPKSVSPPQPEPGDTRDA